ncbi:MAG: primosomal protein N', partial [Candidatus Peregrinibacteria bacterium]
FKEAFGERMALFHSRLTDKQRALEWWKVKTGFAGLVIGSRSAVFAPVQDLGTLIVDEEHEWTYKQESAPYYETHRVAEKLCQLQGAQLILGSATPRLESYQKARAGEYEHVFLTRRIHQDTLPAIHVVDLREEFKKRNFSIFSLTLQNAIAERLKNKEQVILFVNQRGVARAVVCRDCGYTEGCPHCDISLKYHREMGDQKQEIDRLVCHYCGFTKAPSVTCPACRSPYIRQVGVGTQRVEQEMERLFPEARVLRADKDTTGKKDGFAPIYEAFWRREYDVLIGTQMVAKGLDFSGVSLIGIVLADIGLNVPDFRSHERLFSLITQVAGRCGRSASHPGQVVLQTYQPDHFAIVQAARYGYTDFAEKELAFRRKLGYPPFSRLVKFTVVGTDAEKLQRHIQESQEALEDIFKVNGLSIKIVSAPAMVPKVANRYYYHVLLRGENPDDVFKHWKLPKGWRVDIDPVHTA